MNLEDFVSETLSQIVGGVAKAQERPQKDGARINPPLEASREDATRHGYLQIRGDVAQLVQFDVALTVTESKEKGGKLGVVVGIVSFGLAGNSAAEGSSVSRIKFSVPLTLPTEPAQAT